MLRVAQVYEPFTYQGLRDFWQGFGNFGKGALAPWLYGLGLIFALFFGNFEKSTQALGLYGLVGFCTRLKNIIETLCYNINHYSRVNNATTDAITESILAGAILQAEYKITLLSAVKSLFGRIMLSTRKLPSI